jgi:peptide/nickel transport system permease protein
MSTAVSPTFPEATVPVERATARQPHLLRRALRQRRTQIGLVLTTTVLAIALLGPLFAPHSSGELVGAAYQPPGSGMPLGTDYLGEDVFSRLLLGGFSVVWMSLAATTFGVVIGAMVGLTAGYARHWVDDLLMRTMDVVLAFPAIVLVLLFISMVGPKEWLIALMVGVAWTPQVARVARGATVEVAGREYVQAAEALGVPARRILAREVLPNIMTPLTVEFGLRLTWSIGVVAAISFLGAGLQPPAADWGLMIKQNYLGLQLQPWGVIAPVVLIAVFTFGTNFVTEGLARTIAGVDRGGDPR